MEKYKEVMTVEMELRNLSVRTIEAYIWHVERFSKLFGKLPEEMGEEEIRRYLHYLRVERKVSWSNVNMGHSALKFFYVNILHREWNVENIPKCKKEIRLPVVLSREEVKEVIDSISNQKHRVIIMTVYSGGLRVSEASHLKIRDIDSGRMQIRVEQGKGKKDRYTLLSEKLLEELREYYKAYHPVYWLFPGGIKDRPIEAGTIQEIFRTARDKVGIEKEATVHTLRHSFATHLLEQGVDIFTIKELMGHTSIRTTAKYIHIRREHIQKVISPLDMEV